MVEHSLPGEGAETRVGCSAVLLERIVELAPAAVAILSGPEHRFVLANQAYRQLAHGKGQVIGRTVAEVFPELVGNVVPVLDQIFATGQPRSAVDSRVSLRRAGVLADGYFTFSFTPIWSASGQVEGILVLAIETTEQVRNRCRIEELAVAAELNAARLEAVIESLAEGLIIAGPRGNIVALNEAARQLYGFERPDQYPRAIDRFATVFELRTLDGQLVPPAGWPISRLIRGETFQQWELHARRLDVDRSWYASYSGTIARGPAGEPQFLVLSIRDVTAQKTAEREREALRQRADDAQRRQAEAYALLDSLFASAPVGLGFWDRDFRFVRVNPALAAMNGVPVEDHAGKTVHAIAPGVEGLDELMRAWRRIIDTGERLVGVELAGETAAAPGQRRHWLEDWFPVRLGDEIIGLGAVVQDITDQKRADQARRESEERFRVMAESIPGVVYTIDPAGLTDYLNPRWYEYTGAPPGSGLGTGWDEWLHPDDRAHSPLAWLRSQAPGGTFENEFRLRGADGTYRWFLGRCLPVRDEAGAVLKWIGASIEIDDLHRAREGQRFLSNVSHLLSSSFDYETTLREIAALAVPRIADFCVINLVGGWQPARLISAKHVDPTREPLMLELNRAYPPDPHRAASLLGQAQRTGRPVLATLTGDDWLRSFARDDRHRELLEAACTRSFIVASAPLGADEFAVFTIGTDESGRRLDEQDVALVEELARRLSLAIQNGRLYRQAREAIRVRDEFLSIAAHELKTPVTSLRGFAQLALRSLANDHSETASRLRRPLEVIDQQSRRLGQLMTQLLDVARLESGRLALDYASVDLAELLRELAEDAQVRNPRHQIVVRSPVRLIACVDPLRTQQVITNLVDNAVKHAPASGAIELELKQQGDGIAVSVRDFGPGIPAEHLDRIFDRFYQAQPGTHSAGLGLGLYVSREIVERHGGQLTAESPPDGGARFTLWLPLIATDSR